MPRTDFDTRTALRDWVASRNEAVKASDSLDGIPLFGERLLTSLHLPELLLLIERLRGEPLDVAALTADDLATIDAIIERFFIRGTTR